MHNQIYLIFGICALLSCSVAGQQTEKGKALISKLFGSESLDPQTALELVQQVDFSHRASLNKKDMQRVDDLLELNRINEDSCTGVFFARLRDMYETYPSVVPYIEKYRKELMSSCEILEKKRVRAVVNRLPKYFQEDMKKIGHFININTDEYAGLIEGLAECYDDRNFIKEPKQLKDKATFVQGFVEHYWQHFLTLAYDLEDVSLLFKTMAHDKDPYEAARKFFSITDPMTFEWVTYSRIALEIVSQKEEALEEVTDTLREALLIGPKDS